CSPAQSSRHSRLATAHHACGCTRAHWIRRPRSPTISRAASSPCAKRSTSSTCPREKPKTAVERAARRSRHRLRRFAPGGWNRFRPPPPERPLHVGNLLLGERAIELLLERLERLGTRGAARTTRHDESQRTVQRR